ncbi:MAG: tRNA (adenosine(37)-N6)-dimethylallyltransferase MiaA [Defluviitaleaceae bacterium]|nr:tRNA (adenosine(37)-N6)-dimethylallyltransferase MiaA [Defluviitaleaceae bacterium]
MSCQENKDLPYIVIAGQTATGKSALAVSLAGRIGGEIISADSMQVYKYMDIGTAKITADERGGVPHYLLDELYPDDAYSAYEFAKRARPIAEDVRARGLYPIICGGTGFYINALTKNTEFTEFEVSLDLRNDLAEFAGKHGAVALHERLAVVDGLAAEQIHPNNIKRVIRAIEYFEQTGERISAHNARERARGMPNAKVIMLTAPRSFLYEAIDRRVCKMVEFGLVDEVRSLLARGYTSDLTSMQGIGYKEIVEYLNGAYSLAEAVDTVKSATRRFSKKQLTWFTHQAQGLGEWFDVSEYTTELLTEAVLRVL